MTTRLFTSLEYKLTPYVPGCPQPVIKLHVRDAAIETCENTLAWRFEQDLIPLTQGIVQYDYEVPEDTEVVAIFHTTINGIRTPAVTLEQMVAQYPQWPDPSSEFRASPQLVSQFDPDHWVVGPVPDDQGPYSVKMILALRPTPDCDGMDKTVFDECEQLIMHNALARVLSIPDKSWTNNNLAEYHAKQSVFKTAARRAKANLGAGRASLAARMVPFV